MTLINNDLDGDGHHDCYDHDDDGLTEAIADESDGDDYDDYY